MALDLSFVGRTYGPTEPYEVCREKIREFADAIGDPNPVYRDADAAKAQGHADVIAPPTFPIVLTMRASDEVVFDPDLGLDYSQVVHGEQRFVYARPVLAGDRLTVLTTVESIRSAAGNDLITLRGEVSAATGEPVLTGFATLISRGTAAEAET